MIELRPYQKRIVDDLWTWFENNKKGNVCIVVPTGGGKSLIIAEIIKQAYQNWGTKILKISHSREIIAQNAEAITDLWPNVPLGIVSAGLNRKEWGEPITFAGVQSIRGKADWIGKIELIIVDECHLIAHGEEGVYRDLINELTEINPYLRVIGLTASPYRLGHGMITDAPAIFTDLIEPVTIPFLQSQGYLAKLRSKHTELTYNTAGVHKRGGEFIESELQKVVDTTLQNEQAVAEVIVRAENRKHWLFFCTGIKHAIHIRDVVRSHGITCETITGEMGNTERDDIINRFKKGEIKAITNVNVLTIGFNFKNVDLIAMMRPTESPGLYLQIVGRGLRLKEHTDHCLILDFAGNIARHGPITAIKPPSKKGEGGGVAPSKICPECYEIVYPTVKVCPGCGFQFPEAGPIGWRLSNVDIMGEEDEKFELFVKSWHWAIKKNKEEIEMVVCTYYGANHSDPILRRHYCVNHPGYTAIRAKKELLETMKKCGCPEAETDALSKSPHPEKVIYQKQKKNPKYFEILSEEWSQEYEEIPF